MATSRQSPAKTRSDVPEDRSIKVTQDVAAIRRRLLSVSLFAHEDNLRASALVAFDTAAPDKLTSTSGRRDASVFVVTTSATHRIAVGLTETARLRSDPAALSPRSSEASSAPRDGTIVGGLIYVDELLPGNAKPALSLSLPSPSSTFLPGGARIIAVG